MVWNEIIFDDYSNVDFRRDFGKIWFPESAQHKITIDGLVDSEGIRIRTHRGQMNLYFVVWLGI